MPAVSMYINNQGATVEPFELDRQIQTTIEVCVNEHSTIQEASRAECAWQSLR